MNKATRTLLDRYGSDYFKKLGHKGAVKLHQLYDMIPYGTSQFKYVKKQTKESL
jgi:hypothetical protein